MNGNRNHKETLVRGKAFSYTGEPTSSEALRGSGKCELQQKRLLYERINKMKNPNYTFFWQW